MLELLTGASSTIFKQLWSSAAPGGDDDDDDDDVCYGDNDDFGDNDNDDGCGENDDGVNTGAMCITNDPKTAVQ